MKRTADGNPQNPVSSGGSSPLPNKGGPLREPVTGKGNGNSPPRNASSPKCPPARYPMPMSCCPPYCYPFPHPCMPRPSMYPYQYNPWCPPTPAPACYPPYYNNTHPTCYTQQGPYCRQPQVPCGQPQACNYTCSPQVQCCQPSQVPCCEPKTPPTPSDFFEKCFAKLLGNKKVICVPKGGSCGSPCSNPCQQDSPCSSSCPGKPEKPASYLNCNFYGLDAHPCPTDPSCASGCGDLHTGKCPNTCMVNSCKTVPTCAVPCPANPCQTLPTCAVPCPANPCQTFPTCAVPCPANPCQTFPTCAVPCPANPCQTLPTCVVPCPANPYQTLPTCCTAACQTEQEPPPVELVKISSVVKIHMDRDDHSQHPRSGGGKQPLTFGPDEPNSPEDGVRIKLLSKMQLNNGALESSTKLNNRLENPIEVYQENPAQQNYHRNIVKSQHISYPAGTSPDGKLGAPPPKVIELESEIHITMKETPKTEDRSQEHECPPPPPPCPPKPEQVDEGIQCELPCPVPSSLVNIRTTIDVILDESENPDGFENGARKSRQVSKSRITTSRQNGKPSRSTSRHQQDSVKQIRRASKRELALSKISKLPDRASDPPATIHVDSKLEIKASDMTISKSLSEISEQQNTASQRPADEENDRERASTSTREGAMSKIFILPDTASNHSSTIHVDSKLEIRTSDMRISTSRSEISEQSNRTSQPPADVASDRNQRSSTIALSKISTSSLPHIVSASNHPATIHVDSKLEIRSSDMNIAKSLSEVSEQENKASLQIPDDGNYRNQRSPTIGLGLSRISDLPDRSDPPGPVAAIQVDSQLVIRVIKKSRSEPTLKTKKRKKTPKKRKKKKKRAKSNPCLCVPCVPLKKCPGTFGTAERKFCLLPSPVRKIVLLPPAYECTTQPSCHPIQQSICPPSNLCSKDYDICVVVPGASESDKPRLIIGTLRPTRADSPPPVTLTRRRGEQRVNRPRPSASADAKSRQMPRSGPRGFSMPTPRASDEKMAPLKSSLLGQGHQISEPIFPSHSKRSELVLPKLPKPRSKPRTIGPLPMKARPRSSRE